MRSRGFIIRVKNCGLDWPNQILWPMCSFAPPKSEQLRISFWRYDHKYTGKFLMLYHDCIHMRRVSIDIPNCKRFHSTLPDWKIPITEIRRAKPGWLKCLIYAYELYSIRYFETQRARWFKKIKLYIRTLRAKNLFKQVESLYTKALEQSAEKRELKRQIPRAIDYIKKHNLSAKIEKEALQLQKEIARIKI